jgi:glycosyltransferase involved in cell wall biosynthesis
MTIIQAVEQRYSQWLALSQRALTASIERQRVAYTRAAACCATTHWAAESMIRDYGIPRDKVRVVGIGRNRNAKPCERDWSTPRYLFVGKDWERKNGPMVVRCFERLRTRHPHARLDVVGGHPSLELSGAQSHGILNERVPAERRRLEELFETATCLVMPSRHEPAGIVYAEAAAAGVASICAVTGGASEIVGEAGYVVDPEDDDSLLDAMSRMADGATAKRLGNAARERSKLFTWEMVALRLLRALGFRCDQHTVSYL